MPKSPKRKTAKSHPVRFEILRPLRFASRGDALRYAAECLCWLGSLAHGRGGENQPPAFDEPVRSVICWALMDVETLVQACAESGGPFDCHVGTSLGDDLLPMRALLQAARACNRPTEAEDEGEASAEVVKALCELVDARIDAQAVA